MMIQSKIWQAGEFWIAEASAFDIMTQGVSRSDALFMLGDALECYEPKFEFQCRWLDENVGEAVIDTSDTKETLAFILNRHKTAEVSVPAMAPGSQHAESLLAYEAGIIESSLSQLQSLLGAYGKRIMISVIEDPKAD